MNNINSILSNNSLLESFEAAHNSGIQQIAMEQFNGLVNNIKEQDMKNYVLELEKIKAESKFFIIKKW